MSKCQRLPSVLVYSLCSPFPCSVSCNQEWLSFSCKDGSRSRRVGDRVVNTSTERGRRENSPWAGLCNVSNWSTTTADNSLCFMEWFVEIQSKSYCTVVPGFRVTISSLEAVFLICITFSPSFFQMHLNPDLHGRR